MLAGTCVVFIVVNIQNARQEWLRLYHFQDSWTRHQLSEGDNSSKPPDNASDVS